MVKISATFRLILRFGLVGLSCGYPNGSIF